MSLDIRILPPGRGSQRVSVGGRLDTHTYADFDRTLAPVFGNRLHTLVLDLSELEYISSAGIRSLFKARKALAAHGGKLVVANPQPQIQKVFDLVKAVPMEDIFSSVAEADTYLDAMQRKVLEGEEEDEP